MGVRSVRHPPASHTPWAVVKQFKPTRSVCDGVGSCCLANASGLCYSCPLFRLPRSPLFQNKHGLPGCTRTGRLVCQTGEGRGEGSDSSCESLVSATAARGSRTAAARFATAAGLLAAGVQPVAQSVVMATRIARALATTRRGGATARRGGGTTAVAVQEAERLGLTGQNQGSPERQRNN